MLNVKPYSLYVSTRFIQSLLFLIIVTVNLVYQATVVKLNPLQLVLVGTVLETVTFFFEVPTGIVADVYSRKLSTVIGVILTGLGFMVEAIVPSFAFVLLAQIIWGIGFTFITGAREAWITEEIGEEKAGKAFIHGQQAAQLGAMLGVAFSVLLANYALRLPIFLGGLLYSVWGILLIFLMQETNFRPTPKQDRSTLNHMIHTFKDGIKVICANDVLLIMIIIGGVFGMFSEGYDRLWTAYILKYFHFPAVGHFQPVIWFGILNLIGLLLSVLAAEISKRQVNRKNHITIGRALIWVNSLLSLGVVMFGLSTTFSFAVAFYWIVYLLRETGEPIYLTWMNQTLTPQTRATVLSIGSQSNAVGQIVGGPILGFIATVFSLRAGIVVSGLALIPVILLYIYIQISYKVAV